MATTTTEIATQAEADEQARVRSIAFLNWAHAIDHYVILIFPTLVIGLQVIYGRSYAEMIALGTASFVAFGVFSLPAGWLADRWSRRNMMALFYFGCGGSLALAAFAPNLVMLAAALFLLGVFAAIYHPVGMPMLIAAATSRGRTLAFNGVCGNVGAALAAGITAALATWLDWRAAFLIPAALCLVTGVLYLRMVPNDGHKTSSRSQHADVPLSRQAMLTMFGLFIVIAMSAGLVFNIVSVSLPKIVDERLGENVPLLLVGGVATAVFLCGALAQLAMGRLVGAYQRPDAVGGVGAVDGRDLRAGDGERRGDRPLYGGRVARPGLCGALFSDLRVVGRRRVGNRLPVQPWRLRPGARHHGVPGARLRGRDFRCCGAGDRRREAPDADAASGRVSKQKPGAEAPDFAREKFGFDYFFRSCAICRCSFRCGRCLPANALRSAFSPPLA
jgi:MFS family permease